VIRRCMTVVVLVVHGCGPGPEVASVPSDSTLLRDIRQRVADDQAIRDSFALELRTTGTISPHVFERMRSVDSANIAWLRPFIDAAHLPTKKMVGAEGMAALLLLIQHADQDTTLQATALPLVEAAFRAGDVQGQEYAMLTDRVLKARGRLQRYGTQATIEGGMVRIDPIEDSVGVDARRAELGMLPLFEYKRVLDSVYARAQSN